MSFGEPLAWGWYLATGIFVWCAATLSKPTENPTTPLPPTTGPGLGDGPIILGPPPPQAPVAGGPIDITYSNQPLANPDVNIPLSYAIPDGIISGQSLLISASSVGVVSFSGPNVSVGGSNSFLLYPGNSIWLVWDGSWVALSRGFG